MKKYKIGILQINPHTLWRKGGGELHAKKYIELGNNSEFSISYFQFENAAEYDLIHFFGSAYQMNEIGKYAQLQEIKVVGTPILFPSTAVSKYRVALAISKQMPFKNSLQMRNELLHDSDLLIANSLAEKNYLANAYKVPAEKIKVLGTGVSENYLNYHFDISHVPDEIKHLKNYLLVVGRVVSLKNQLEILEIFKKENYPLVLVGQADPDEKEYVQQVQAMVEKYQHFYWLKNLQADSNALKATYHQALAHILWSKTEVAALVNIEAMALACPVICRDLISTKSILKNHALFAQDAASLKKAVSQITNWDQEQRKTFVTENKNLIEEKFTWEKLIAQNLIWYKELLAQHD